MAVGVAHTNADAIRFYEREGFEPFYVLMLRVSGGDEVRVKRAQSTQEPRASSDPFS